MFAAPNDIASPSARAVNDIKLHFEKLVDDSGEVVFATLGELNPEYGITAGMLKSNAYKVYGELTLMMGVSETNLLAYREGDKGDGNSDDGRSGSGHSDDAGDNDGEISVVSSVDNSDGAGGARKLDIASGASEAT